MTKALKEIIKENAFIIKNINDIDLSPFSSQLTKATVVLLGESSHGTDEFYRIRSQITQKLIKDYLKKKQRIGQSNGRDLYRIDLLIVKSDLGHTPDQRDRVNRTWMDTHN